MDIKIKFTAIALMFTASAGAQTLSQAQRWFTQGEFEKAKPVFKKLVKQSPSNASYNFWYGACCYETGEMMEGLPYLEKSAARKVINAYLYVSKAYYDMYRYDDAIENLEQHIYWLKQKKRDTTEAEELMGKYRKGARLIRSVENITVIDSFVVDKRSFLDAYKLGEQSGNLQMTDNGNEDVSIEFVNEMGDKKLLSANDENGNKKLYASVKLIDSWSKPQRLKGINDDMTDLNFPFLDSDGTTLYFAAKGEESLGGYDIFITRADSEENSYFRPDNMGYPFNSAFNDYMYAIDDYNNLGWFASDRYQPEGKVCVYVFIPNESKTTYDYDTVEPGKMISLARLDNIALTQTDRNEVARAKQRLAKVTYAKTGKKNKKTEFTFIVNDNRTYTSLNDFRKPEAKKMFQEMRKMQSDLETLENELDKLREKYSKSNKAVRESMTPGILDKEKRVNGLRTEIGKMETKIRNMELK
ncbi:tetratricopeptide repeat protein [Bacteroides caecigallinarum]|uniref:tetratricopeptide repeat protein n=1 Tax=Bacteroides caecigallinarum TaxID=1411144 RepID=UPI00195E4DF6|nr:tetratricopeptide repeat protein [Bacteroides caecigallinarum]MBM6866589.1 tetratricopeptide repeat protein [Bacteroides caecigallinarum]